MRSSTSLVRPRLQPLRSGSRSGASSDAHFEAGLRPASAITFDEMLKDPEGAKSMMRLVDRTPVFNHTRFPHASAHTHTQTGGRSGENGLLDARCIVCVESGKAVLRTASEEARASVRVSPPVALEWRIGSGAWCIRSSCMVGADEALLSL